MQGHDIERVKNGDGEYVIHCVQCDSVFSATRSDAGFAVPVVGLLTQMIQRYWQAQLPTYK